MARVDLLTVFVLACSLAVFVGDVLRRQQPPLARCTRPPAGWYCTRGLNHQGPCAAHPESA